MLTIRNGSGGVNNEGKLTINDSTITGNCCGSGIANRGTLTISDSTITGNGAPFGGGIGNVGTLTINNSTLSGNYAYRTGCPYLCYGGIGGAVWNVGGHLTTNNATLSGNGATLSGGGIYKPTGTATLQNSIVANNSGGNCSGSITSKGYNVDSDGTCNFHNSGDRNTDPMLGTLGNYGGPIQTIPLLPGSPAIDGGNPSGCTDGNGHVLKADQRGYPRPDKEDKAGCDMGAYERQSD